MLITEDIIMYYCPDSNFKKLLSDIKPLEMSFEINLKGLYVFISYWIDYEILENEPLLKYYYYYNYSYFFQKESDILLFKLKYGL